MIFGASMIVPCQLSGVWCENRRKWHLCDKNWKLKKCFRGKKALWQKERMVLRYFKRNQQNINGKDCIYLLLNRISFTPTFGPVVLWKLASELSHDLWGMKLRLRMPCPVGGRMSRFGKLGEVGASELESHLAYRCSFGGQWNWWRIFITYWDIKTFSGPKKSNKKLPDKKSRKVDIFSQKQKNRDPKPERCVFFCFFFAKRSERSKLLGFKPPGDRGACGWRDQIPAKNGDRLETCHCGPQAMRNGLRSGEFSWWRSKIYMNRTHFFPTCLIQLEKRWTYQYFHQDSYFLWTLFCCTRHFSFPISARRYVVRHMINDKPLLPSTVSSSKAVDEDDKTVRLSSPPQHLGPWGEVGCIECICLRMNSLKKKMHPVVLIGYIFFRTNWDIFCFFSKKIGV